MMKILHAADLHLDAPLTGFSEDATARLRREMLSIPDKIVEICRRESCDLLLLAGDLFDGDPSPQSVRALRSALEDVGIPVLIAPGNHDFCHPGSPWLTAVWPENVHIFTAPVVESVAIPELDCRVYGAGFTSMDCPALLERFCPEGEERYHIGVFHGDPARHDSPYNPVTKAQAGDTGFDYLALGHVHAYGSFAAGKTLCAWPGCPMGHGYDECGEKGVLLVELEEQAAITFCPLHTTRFYDLQVPVRTGAEEALSMVLPAVESGDFYRVTLTGECEKPDLKALQAVFSHCHNLELRDKTSLPVDVWQKMDSDSLEGLYFRMLHDAMEGQDEQSRRIALQAAMISRKILDGEEVTLL